MCCDLFKIKRTEKKWVQICFMLRIKWKKKKLVRDMWPRPFACVFTGGCCLYTAEPAGQLAEPETGWRFVLMRPEERQRQKARITGRLNTAACFRQRCEEILQPAPVSATSCAGVGKERLPRKIKKALIQMTQEMFTLAHGGWLQDSTGLDTALIICCFQQICFPNSVPPQFV